MPQGARWTGRTLQLLLALSFAWPPAVLALQHEGLLPAGGPADREARPLHVLEYHPYPDPEGDPWGVPAEAHNESETGHMEAAYGSYWYPTAVVDGLVKIEGSTGFLQSYNDYEAAFLERRKLDTPVQLALAAGRGDEGALVEAALTAKRALASDDLRLRIVLFEDEVRYDGGNGVNLHRFTVRAVAYDARLAFAPNGTASARATVDLDAAWNADRLGFVASLHNRDATSLDFKPNEVVQAATVLLGQAGPTIQHSKGVLLEVLTATWCAACVYGDAVVNELANAYGLPSSKLLDREWTYLRPPPWASVASAGGIGILAAGGLWRLRGRGGTP